MQKLAGTLRYTLRQFRLSPVFTSAAILTLVLGIGGTTAIFTLIHAVMLQSLPVSDPSLLCRIGEGDDCCVEGGPQNQWGTFSFALYERLKEATPEFEEDVVRHVLGGAFVRVLIGLVLAVPLAVAAGRLISNQLYEVSFWDPPALTLTELRHDWGRKSAKWFRISLGNGRVYTTFAIEFEPFGEGEAELSQKRFLLGGGFGDPRKANLTTVGSGQDNVGALQRGQESESLYCR
jgi:hypothetical protein